MRVSKLYSWFNRFDPYEILFQRLPALYRREDAILHRFVLMLFFLAIAQFAYNDFTHQYTSLNYPTILLTATPGLFVVWLTGVVLRDNRPRTGLFLTSFAQSILYIFIMAFVLSAAITTPFPIIDHYLLNIDNLLHFDTNAVLNWSYQYPLVIKLLRFAYSTWFPLAFLTPMLLALLKQQEEIDVYFIATFIAFCIGVTIYYLMPTIAPAGILDNPHFTQGQHDLVRRFYEAHASQSITAMGGGMIAFPSFHIINSLTVLYAWRRWRWTFFPMLGLIVLIIPATLFLGYHYLVDVIASVFIVCISIYLAKKMVSTAR